ncbi:MAG TPA: hypothetical protein DDX57_04265 [Bacteroidales bacterium]|nr:hypothetical protein [Bacteroidales bacterium]
MIDESGPFLFLIMLPETTGIAHFLSRIRNQVSAAGTLRLAFVTLSPRRCHPETTSDARLATKIKNDNGANIIFHRPMATKEAEDMESLCLPQNRRFHILRFSPNDGISVLTFCLIFRGLYECVISSGVEGLTAG